MQRLVQVAKWVWIILLAVGVGWYLIRNFADVAIELQKISPLRVSASLVLLLIGRLLIVQLARDSVAVVGFQHSYIDLFQMVGLSELAKYIPGGIWHFVGRAGFYRNAGLTVTQASRAIFIEHVWLVVSAGLGGSFLLLMVATKVNIMLIGAAFVVLWLISIGMTLRQSDLKINTAMTHLFLLQAGVWLSLGMSYWVLLPKIYGAAIWMTIGAFAISWLVGFLTVLAPGGLGTREAAIAALMLPLVAAQTSIILSSVHRLLWICVEILLGLATILIRNRENVCTVLK